MSISLTPAGIKNILSSNTHNNNYNYIFQVIKIKQIQNRYKLIISDSEYYYDAFLASNITDLIISNKLKENYVIKVKEYICNKIQDKITIIIFELDIFYKSNIIGTPQSFKNNNINNKTINEEKHKFIIPIIHLNPYICKWKIKVKISRKTTIRHWNNSNNSGKLFNIDLCDNNGEIRATCFNEMVDKYFDIFEENQIYYISNGHIKPTNKRYNKLNHEYEIVINNSSIIELCNDNDNDTSFNPTMQYNFQKIIDLKSFNIDDIVDIIGIIYNIEDITIISPQPGINITKRNIQIIDDSNYSVEITLWRDKAIKFSHSKGDIIAIKSARISKYNGISLSFISFSSFEVNPNIPETDNLQEWYNKNKTITSIQSLYNDNNCNKTNIIFPRKTFAELQLENINSGKQLKFSNITSIINIPILDIFCYPSCTTTNCYKKVTKINDSWICYKCNTLCTNPIQRYVLNICISDYTGYKWVTLFDDIAQQLLGQPADIINTWKQNNNEKALYKLYNNVLFQTYNMNIIAKEQIYNGKAKLKYYIQSFTPIDYIKESKTLVESIQQLTQ